MVRIFGNRLQNNPCRLSKRFSQAFARRIEQVNYHLGLKLSQSFSDLHDKVVKIRVTCVVRASISATLNNFIFFKLLNPIIHPFFVGKGVSLFVACVIFVIFYGFAKFCKRTLRRHLLIEKI